MFFRVWFYVSKVGAALFILCFVGILARGWIPETRFFERVILFILLPMGIVSACLAVAIFVFGMRMKCPFCRRLGKVGGRGHTLWLECPHCGMVYGHIIRDFTLRIEPPEKDEEK